MHTIHLVQDILDKENKKWKDFYNEYLKRGGDGFYGSVMNPYLEPSLRYKSLSSQKLDYGLCPNFRKNTK